MAYTTRYSETLPDYWNPKYLFSKHVMLQLDLHRNNTSYDEITIKNEMLQQISEKVTGAIPVQIEAGWDPSRPAEELWYGKAVLAVTDPEHFYMSGMQSLMSLSNEELKQNGIPYTKEDLYRITQSEGGLFVFPAIPIGWLILGALIVALAWIVITGFERIAQVVRDILISPAGQLIAFGIGAVLLVYAWSKLRESGKKKESGNGSASQAPSIHYHISGK